MPIIISILCSPQRVVEIRMYAIVRAWFDFKLCFNTLPNGFDSQPNGGFDFMKTTFGATIYILDLTSAFVLRFRSSHLISYEFELVSYEYDLTSYKFDLTSCDFVLTSYEFDLISYEFVPTSYEFGLTFHKFNVTSDDFELKMV